MLHVIHHSTPWEAHRGVDAAQEVDPQRTSIHETLGRHDLQYEAMEGNFRSAQELVDMVGVPTSFLPNTDPSGVWDITIYKLHKSLRSYYETLLVDYGRMDDRVMPPGLISSTVTNMREAMATCPVIEVYIAPVGTGRVECTQTPSTVIDRYWGYARLLRAITEPLREWARTHLEQPPCGPRMYQHMTSIKSSNIYVLNLP